MTSRRTLIRVTKRESVSFGCRDNTVTTPGASEMYGMAVAWVSRLLSSTASMGSRTAEHLSGSKPGMLMVLGVVVVKSSSSL
ncbi:hypothetical protein D3C85_1785600 [compost metagenome]